jgi:nucleotide-binding universal stress UspA family protein
MYETILVPTDGSDAAERALDPALALAAPNATVHLLSVIDTADLGLTTPTDADLDEIRSGIRVTSERAVERLAERAREAGHTAETEVRVGVPHEVVRAVADERGVDLVAMGSHGRTGLAHALLGSTTERVLRRSAVPVLVVRDRDD